ncbi:hypothetical protein Tcan_03364 [Toxocara canis]|uniref:Uncharacterized protein n=1 Tax=Toxocara canis TaxID=6265 RepID=A0A0B2VKD0_TOXCA|nr:hypothetical protein Tcan_03364 [Toxocara canis]
MQASPPAAEILTIHPVTGETRNRSVSTPEATEEASTLLPSRTLNAHLLITSTAKKPTTKKPTTIRETDIQLTSLFFKKSSTPAVTARLPSGQGTVIEASITNRTYAGTSDNREKFITDPLRASSGHSTMMTSSSPSQSITRPTSGQRGFTSTTGDYSTTATTMQPSMSADRNGNFTSTKGSLSTEMNEDIWGKIIVFLVDLGQVMTVVIITCTLIAVLLKFLDVF